MFQHQNIWLPDGEKHFPQWMDKNGELVDGRGTYQIKKFREALRHVKQWRTAVDVGAHVGLWTMQLAKRFKMVHAFEPMEVFRECWKRNVTADGVMIHPVALGARDGFAIMRYDPADSGGTHVESSDFASDFDGAVTMMRMDDLDLLDVDFVKIDCEGFEHHVIEGARETLLRWKPCVIVEQKPHKLGPNFGIKGAPAVDALVAMGATIRAVMGGDYMLAW
jgi:FkbM family methyltransferase